METQKRINTTVDVGDYDYCARNGIKFAHAIRQFVAWRREAQNPISELNTLRERNNKILKHRDKMLEVLRDLDKKPEFAGIFDKFIQSI